MPFCQLIITTTFIVIIASIAIVINTVVSIHHPSSIIHPRRRPSSLITQKANANLKTHLSAVGLEPTRSCLQRILNTSPLNHAGTPTVLHFPSSASHVGELMQPSSPQQCREVALYPQRTQGRPQQAELSGAANADEEMDDGAACFR